MVNATIKTMGKCSVGPTYVVGTDCSIISAGLSQEGFFQEQYNPKGGLKFSGQMNLLWSRFGSCKING